MKEKIKRIIKNTIEFVLNPRLLLCFGLAWVMTNGWAYIAFVFASYFNIPWLSTIAGSYLAILWFPFTPEKIITIAIAIFLLKLLFPNDTKTLQKLYNMKEKIKEKAKEVKNKKNEK